MRPPDLAALGNSGACSRTSIHRPHGQSVAHVANVVSPMSRLTRSLASFIAAWCSLKLLQANRSSLKRRRAASLANARYAQADPQTGRELAGRTMDLTLFAATQAVDVIIGELWARHKARRQRAGTWTKVPLSHLSPLSLYLLSARLGSTDDPSTRKQEEHSKKLPVESSLTQPRPRPSFPP